jgi:hypothetical protein
MLCLGWPSLLVCFFAGLMASGLAVELLARLHTCGLHWNQVWDNLGSGKSGLVRLAET